MIQQDLSAEIRESIGAERLGRNLQETDFDFGSEEAWRDWIVGRFDETE